jgi:tetraacyldisaccharide 4'-kinase
MKKLLSPFSFLYGAITNVRNYLFERDIFKSQDLQMPTISIGNITVGGTGKTPLVAFVAKILAGQGEKVCILTRGYGRENPKDRVLVSDGEKILADAREAGDEPFELANKLLGISAIVADANRVEAGNWARENLGITAFVLDDAFQHLKVKRDLDIVCIDATNPFGNGKILPNGILREPLENLKRADAIVITRANLVDADNISNLKLKISEVNRNCKIFVSENKIVDLIKIKDFPAKVPRRNEETKDKGQRTKDKYLAFCALGNPESFFEQLRREEFNLVGTKKFPDHHFYTRQDIKKIENEAVACSAEILLTTAKDAVKLAHLRFNFSCFVVESGLIFDDDPAFKKLIQNLKPKA